MNSQALPQFWNLYYRLPEAVRQRAAKAYRIWLENPDSHGLKLIRLQCVRYRSEGAK